MLAHKQLLELAPGFVLLRIEGSQMPQNLRSSANDVKGDRRLTLLAVHVLMLTVVRRFPPSTQLLAGPDSVGVHERAMRQKNDSHIAG